MGSGTEPPSPPGPQSWERARTLTFFEKLIFGMGRGGTLMISTAFMILIKPFYVPSDGGARVRATTVGNILLFGRIVDALADPMIGFMSDRTESRWGRRIPFMAFSALPLCLFFILLFNPLTEEQSLHNTLWLAVIQGLFWFFYTSYTCPLLGLIPTIARTDAERLNLQTVAAYMIGICGGVGAILSPALKDILGFRATAALIAAVACLMFYAPVFGIPERQFGPSAPSTFPLRKALAATFSNRPFLMVLVSLSAFRFGFNIIQSGIIYYVELLMGFPAEASGVVTSKLMLTFFVVACLTFPVVNLAARRYGKKKLALVSGSGLGLALPLLYLLPSPPLGLTPLAMAVIVVALGGMCLATLLMLYDVIMADVADLDAHRTGQRREAIYYGAVGLTEKATIGVSEWFMMFMIGHFGKRGNKALGVRLTGPICGLITFIALAFFLPYPERYDRDTGQWTLLPPGAAHPE